MTDKKMYCKNGHEIDEGARWQAYGGVLDLKKHDTIVLCLLGEGDKGLIVRCDHPDCERHYFAIDCTSEPPQALKNHSLGCPECGFIGIGPHDCSLQQTPPTISNSKTVEEVELLIDKLVGLTCEFYSWEAPPQHVIDHLKKEAKNTRNIITDILNQTCKDFLQVQDSNGDISEPLTDIIVGQPTTSKTETVDHIPDATKKVEYCECEEPWPMICNGPPHCAKCSRPIGSNGVISSNEIPARQPQEQIPKYEKIDLATSRYVLGQVIEALGSIEIKDNLFLHDDKSWMDNKINQIFTSLLKKLKELRDA